MWIVAVILAFTVFISGFASEDTSQAAEPYFLITAHFPEENPFHHVVNGERNSLYLLVDNKSEVNSTLKSVAGSFHHPESQALVKNISTTNVPVPSLAGSKFTIPFSFHSELKPGDYSLHIWVDHIVDESLYRISAYDGIVTVVEPETSIFDFKMISTYFISALVVLAGTYFGVLSLFPTLSKPKRKRATKSTESETSGSGGTLKPSGVTGYQEEWIPELHLKKTPTRRSQKKTTGEGPMSSGDEKVATSGPESGTEGLRRSKRGRKT